MHCLTSYLCVTTCAAAVIKVPPYEVTELGWGEFGITITVKFYDDSEEKAVTVAHALKLFPEHKTQTTAAKGDGEHEGELVVDYTKLPKSKDPRWPPIQENGGLIGGIVYGRMIDYVRGISSHVSIGKAYKAGKPRGFFFAMVRRDPT